MSNQGPNDYSHLTYINMSTFTALPTLPTLPPASSYTHEDMMDEDEGPVTELVEVQIQIQDPVAALTQSMHQLNTLIDDEEEEEEAVLDHMPDYCDNSSCEECCVGEYTHTDDCPERSKTPDYPPHYTSDL